MRNKIARKVYVVRRLCLSGRGVGCPASNNSGWVTSVGVIPAGAAGFVEILCADFFSPVTVTAPSFEMVKTRKSPGFTLSTSSNAWSNRTSPIVPTFVCTAARLNFRSCFSIKQPLVYLSNITITNCLKKRGKSGVDRQFSR